MGPGHFPLGPLESSSPASDFGGNPLRFFGGESSSHGVEGNRDNLGPFHNDMGPRHFPLGPLESSSPASDFGGNPFKVFWW
ncbi:hypothetical protein Godav_015817 [Gossypium davidsonii]|uniref:Uncharacterized protein n=1 Tax=Gossypium davidsonii TaxID=34287 RepID=A0A7J8RQ77_GOSDV|nr:hypothetical protein [Gossypium davidsonii]